MDLFSGSGSCGEACLNTGRRYFGMELDENYFTIMKERLEKAEEGKDEG